MACREVLKTRKTLGNAGASACVLTAVPGAGPPCVVSRSVRIVIPAIPFSTLPNAAMAVKAYFHF